MQNLKFQEKLKRFGELLLDTRGSVLAFLIIKQASYQDGCDAVPFYLTTLLAS